MYAALHRADAWAGLPAGTAKQFHHLLSAFQEARPYLGLPAYADTLLTFLVKQTRAVDWEEGNRPIAWPSNRHLAEILEVTDLPHGEAARCQPTGGTG
jgi:replication initiation protein RepC